MLHLTCGISLLLHNVFFISLVHRHHPAVLRDYALMLEQLLTFLVAFSTLVFKPFLSQNRSLHSHLAPPQADRLEL